MNRRLIALVAGSMVAGGAGAWFLQPVIAPDPRIAAANQRADDAAASATARKQRADSFEKLLDAASRGKRESDARLATAEAAQTQLAGKVADETTQRKAAEAVQARLKGAIDRTTGAITIDRDEVHLQISDRVLFKPGDDALTDRGKVVLSKVGAALEELPDKRVWVHGFADEPPAGNAARPGKESAKPTAASAKKVARPAVAAVRFPTTWELSAARALAVVHYFQDVARLDPARLAALVLGSHAAASKDRSVNRRLEIVIAPRRVAAK